MHFHPPFFSCSSNSSLFHSFIKLLKNPSPKMNYFLIHASLLSFLIVFFKPISQNFSFPCSYLFLFFVLFLGCNLFPFLYQPNVLYQCHPFAFSFTAFSDGHYFLPIFRYGDIHSLWGCEVLSLWRCSNPLVDLGGVPWSTLPTYPLRFQRPIRKNVALHVHKHIYTHTHSYIGPFNFFL